MTSTDDMFNWVTGQQLYKRKKEEGSHSWIGSPMMNPKGEIGIVVEDDNGISGGRYRLLTVNFKDGHNEVLTLANVGGNPLESRKWKWFFEHDGKQEWVPWRW